MKPYLHAVQAAAVKHYIEDTHGTRPKSNINANRSCLIALAILG